MKRIRVSAPRVGGILRSSSRTTYQSSSLLISQQQSTPPTSPSPSLLHGHHPRRHAGSISQRPDSPHVMFPGAVKSAFSNTLAFERPSTYPALSTYRAVDQHGVAVDPSFEPDLTDEQVVKLYRDMLTVSIMDLIMFDAQRQGRLSFYMVSAGEEAVSVATASALEKEDVVFCQYREQGVFKQRGFTLGDFMNQLFANRKDPGKGRNMPVHYGSRELNIVGFSFLFFLVSPSMG